MVITHAAGIDLRWCPVWDIRIRRIGKRVCRRTMMQALLDFTLSSREALQKAVVFLIVSVTGRVLFPVRHAEAASSEAVSVLWVGGRGKIGC